MATKKRTVAKPKKATKRKRLAAAPKVKKEPAFNFVIEALLSSRIGNSITVRPMFGAHAIYRGEEILFILRHRDNETSHDNGMWVVTSGVETDRLLADFKSLRALKIFEAIVKKNKEGAMASWINLPEDSASFESDAFALLELAIQRDRRIGRIPKSKSKK